MARGRGEKSGEKREGGERGERKRWEKERADRVWRKERGVGEREESVSE